MMTAEYIPPGQRGRALGMAVFIRLVTRLEIHPDYRESDDGEIVLGMA